MAKMSFQEMMQAANAAQGTEPMAGNDGVDDDVLQSSFFPPAQRVTVAPVPYAIYDHTAQLRNMLGAEQMRQAAVRAAGAGVVASPDVAVASDASAPAEGTPVAPPLDGDATAASVAEQAPSAVRSFATNEMARGTALEKYSTAGLLNNLEDAEVDNQYLASADDADADVKRKQDNELNAIQNLAAAKAKQQEDRMAAITERGEAAATAQMSRIKQAAQEASQASIHNFWRDKSTGARILGILAQAFSGAANGLAGNPSAPTPLDRVIQRDMDLQLSNIQQKNRNLGNQRGVLRDIYQQTGSSMHALSAMYQAAWQRVDMQAAALKTKYANETADAAYQRVHALAQERTRTESDKTFATLRTSSIQQQQNGVALLAEDDRTNAMAQPSDSGENAKIFHLAGTNGGVDARTYEKFKEANEGYRTVMAQAEHIKQIALDYKAGKIPWAQALQDYNTARSDMLAAQRKGQGTGAALSPEEFSNLQAVLPMLKRSMIPGLSDSFAADLPSQLDRIMATSSRRYFGFIGNSIKGITLNPSDPVYGRHAANYMREIAAQQAQAQ